MKKLKKTRPPRKTAKAEEAAVARVPGIDLADPMAVLKLVKDVIVGRTVNQADARDALERVFQHHENQLRVFLVATAKSKLERIIKCSEFIEQVERALFNPVHIQDATLSQLIKMYSFAWSTQSGDLDFVKKIADMNLEIQKILGVVTAGGLNDKVRDVLSNAPSMESRSRIRQVVEECLALIEEEAAETIDVSKKER